jgi:hypothetical protein
MKDNEEHEGDHALVMYMSRKDIMKGKAHERISYVYHLYTANHMKTPCFASSEYACGITTAKSWMYRQRKQESTLTPNADLVLYIPLPTKSLSSLSSNNK